jgi:hypothetical protein
LETSAPRPACINSVSIESCVPPTISGCACIAATIRAPTLLCRGSLDHVPRAHVDALAGAIKKAGGRPVKAPQVAFPLSNQASFLKLAEAFEDTGVSAYNGAAPMISSSEVLAAAGGIVQIEARHAAAIRVLRGDNPTKGAFDSPLKKPQVLKAVKPFLKG